MVTLTNSIMQVQPRPLASRLALAAVLILAACWPASAQSIFLPGPGAAASSSSLLNGLVAYWKLDEASGTVVADATGHGYDGVASALITRDAGKIGNSAVSPADTQGITVAKSFGTLTDFAFSCWVKTSVNQNEALFNISASDWSGSDIWINKNRIDGGNTVVAEIIDSAGMDFTVQGTQVVGDGIWHHILVTKNGNTVSLYIDGVLNAAITHTWTTIILLANETTLMTDPAADGVVGSYDEAAFWNRGLTVAEIAALYNSGAGRQYPF